MEFKTVIVNFLLVGLIVLCLLGAISTFASDNQIDTEDLENPTISAMTSSLGDKLNQSRSEVIEREEAFKNEGRNPIVSAIEFIFFSILEAANLFIDTSTSIFSSMTTFLGQVLGIPSFVIGTLSAILIVILILAAWRVHKAGS